MLAEEELSAGVVASAFFMLVDLLAVYVYDPSSISDVHNITETTSLNVYRTDYNMYLITTVAVSSVPVFKKGNAYSCFGIYLFME